MGADRVSGIFWLAFGAFCMYGSVQLGLGTFREPGTGFFSLLAACFFSALALLVLLQSFLGKGFEARLSSMWKDTLWYRPLFVGILMAVYVIALERLGFLLTSLVLLLVMLKAVEKFSWWKSALIAGAASGCTYLLFHVLLKAVLPIGVFGI